MIPTDSYEGKGDLTMLEHRNCLTTAWLIGLRTGGAFPELPL